MKTTLLLFVLLSFVPQQAPENTVALVFPDRVEIVSEAKARTEFQQLQNKAVMTKDDQSRFVALTIALGIIPGRCTDSQAAAGLCQQPMCITKDQHVAEVTSWWAAPERVYVRCDDPRVRAPKQ